MCTASSASLTCRAERSASLNTATVGIPASPSAGVSARRRCNDRHEPPEHTTVLRVRHLTDWVPSRRAPNLRAVVMMRQAISPRFAMSSLSMATLPVSLCDPRCWACCANKLRALHKAPLARRGRVPAMGPHLFVFQLRCHDTTHRDMHLIVPVRCSLVSNAAGALITMKQVVLFDCSLTTFTHCHAAMLPV